MSEQNTLREAYNNVEIEGVLLEVRHQEWKSKEGLNIELDIEVAENEIHTVSGMSKYKKADGSENGIAKGYKTIIDEYKSVASHGREEADKVRVNQGKVGVNEYYGQDGKLKSFPQLTSNFFNRVSPGEEYAPKAEFEVEVFVKSTSPEIKNDEETGRLKLEGIIPLYGGKVIPFSFVVNEEGADYVDSNYEAGDTAKVYGDIINFKEKVTVMEKAAFGKDKEKVTYKTLREYLITGGVDPYDEENANSYKVDSIKQAMVERETYLAELKNQSQQPKAEEKKGFGKKSSDAPAKKKIELPF
ncbi:hypothetical protein LCM23_13060 [Cytobacillus kochii]|uniref:hypothetical protein n=1 Tax=Cytobacillus kochii TaxID=859143 RepID=UPI001CD34E53|nr:hypothetical protein [Cytobacillus kochii]MCA1027024.1 hypothetical protein [Cytobacillus kochii]